MGDVVAEFYFIPDEDYDGVPDGKPKVLLDGFGTHANAHNIANGFAWGPDGWLYATHGRSNWSLVGKPGTPEAERRRIDGGVWRYHPVQHRWEILLMARPIRGALTGMITARRLSATA